MWNHCSAFAISLLRNAKDQVKPFLMLIGALDVQWEHARVKISEAEREARHVEYKMREAADLARRSNEARSEAEQAIQLEQETRNAAKDLPGRTRAYLYDTRSVVCTTKAVSTSCPGQLCLSGFADANVARSC